MKKLLLLLWIVLISGTTGILYWISSGEPAKFCPDCGWANDQNEKGCRRCGSQFEDGE